MTGQESDPQLPQDSPEFAGLPTRFQVLQIREAFEAAWSSGAPPSIRRFLTGLRSPLVEEVVRALVPDDIQLRRASGRDPAAGRYIAELPEFSALIRSCLDQTPENAPTCIGDAPPAASAWTSGQWIGPYKLLQELGHGGMGDVWMAEQREPVRRRVALKLIRMDRIGKTFISRFEAERQALALMDHQHIAKVLDAGTTAQGQPYFAMELINGRPITEFCDENKLAVADRLRLFSQTCQAIQHAHQKGIIHRDIKPTNILVTQHDGSPVVKVIDFGLAKAFQASQQLTDKTLFTEFGQVLGTYQYMSPEQAEMNSLDVDTRSDVYSLGVLLYELLTGTTPLERQRIHELAFDRLMAAIREEEAPRPSRRLSSSGDSASGISEYRKTDPRRLGAILKGDLDWIAMKALEKDRSRRYDSPAQMAEDVQRYLSSEAILARPPSASYRLSKAVRRHRGPVITGVMFVLLLIAGLLGTGYMWWEAATLAEENNRLAQKATHAREVAVVRSREAEESAAAADASARAAEANADKALREQRIAESVREFLQESLLSQASVYEQALTLTGSANASSVQHDVTVRDLLKRAAGEFSPDRIDEIFPGEPEVQCEVLSTIAQASQACEEHATAIEYAGAARDILEEALGRNHPKTLTATVDLMFTQFAASRHTEGLDEMLRIVDSLEEELSRNGLTDGEKVDAAETEERASSPLGTEAVEAVISSIERRIDPRRFILPRAPDDIADIFSAGWKIMVALPQMHRLSEIARTLYGPDHRYTLFAQGIAAVGYQALQQHENAAAIYEEIIARADGRQDIDEMVLAGLKRILAIAYEEQGVKPQETLRLIEEFHVVMVRRAGPEHPLTLMSLLQLADAREEYGDSDDTVSLYEQVLALQEKQLGPTHPQTMSTRWEVGIAYLDADRYLQAIPVLQQQYELECGEFGKDHSDTLLTMYRLAQAWHGAGDLEKARALFEEELERERRQEDLDPEIVSTTLHELALVYRDAGELERATELLEESRERRLADLGPNAADTQLTIRVLARVYAAAGNYAAAEEVLRKALEDADDVQSTSAARGTLRQVYLETGQTRQLFELIDAELEILHAAFAPKSVELAGQFVLLGKEMLHAGVLSVAERLFRDALAIRESEMPEGWLRFNAESLLGETLLQQGAIEEALPLLRSGYDGIRHARSEIPASIRSQRQLEAIDRLLNYATVTHDAAAQRRWEAERKRLTQ